MMNGHVEELKTFSEPGAGTIEAPTITLLGSLDDSQGGTNLSLSSVSSKPIFGIIYSAL